MSSILRASQLISVSIIQAEVYVRVNQAAVQYSATLAHGLTRYQTPVFPLSDKKIHFEKTKSFEIQYLLNNQKRLYQPFLRVTLNPLGPSPLYQALIDERTIFSWISQSTKRHSTRQIVLSYPLISKERTVVGEVKLCFGLLSADHQRDLVKSSRFSLNISKQSSVFERKRICSDGSYFKPCISNKIDIKVAEEEYDEECKLSGFRDHSKRHQNLENSGSGWQPFKEELSQIQQSEYKMGHESHKAIQDEIQQIETIPQPLNYQLQLEGTNTTPKTDDQRLEEVPEDFRHLFQKISQINKKYAPLERIPSQEELSEEGSFLKRQTDSESFYSLSSDIDIEKERQSSHLSRAEQFLKELNLYKFGRSLASQEEVGSNIN